MTVAFHFKQLTFSMAILVYLSPSILSVSIYNVLVFQQLFYGRCNYNNIFVIFCGYFTKYQYFYYNFNVYEFYKKNLVKIFVNLQLFLTVLLQWLKLNV